MYFFLEQLLPCRWRLAGSAMSNAKKRPAIYIGSDCCIWIGNTSDTAIQCDPGELFGFGTGAFEEKAVSQLDVMFFFLLCACFFVSGDWVMLCREWEKKMLLVFV